MPTDPDNTDPLLVQAREATSENAAIDFKANLDVENKGQWLEVLKDLVAMANSGGGAGIGGTTAVRLVAHDSAEPCKLLNPDETHPYGRRTLPEYIQFLYYAKGSLGETLPRSIGLHNVGLLSADQFESLDALHYEVENKLLGLIRSLDSKRADGSWDNELPAAHHPPSPIPPGHA